MDAVTRICNCSIGDVIDDILEEDVLSIVMHIEIHYVIIKPHIYEENHNEISQRIIFQNCPNQSGI